MATPMRAPNEFPLSYAEIQRKLDEIQSGPIKYEANSYTNSFIWFTIISLFFGKLSLFTYLIVDSEKYYANETRKPNGPVSVVLFVTAFNIWPYSFLYNSRRRVCFLFVTFDLLQKTIRTLLDTFFTLGFLFFCVEMISLILCTHIYYLGNTNQIAAAKHLAVMIFVCVVEFILSVVVLIATSISECNTHDPIKGSDHYFLQLKYEEATMRNKPITILASSSFRVTIQNISAEPFGEEIFLERRVKWYTRSNEAGYEQITTHRDNFGVKIKLDPPLQPGQILHFIPETHEMPGAIKILGYRSFGKFQRHIVKTRIYYGKVVQNEEGIDTCNKISLFEFFDYNKALAEIETRIQANIRFLENRY